MAASIELADEDELKAQIADGSTAIYFFADWDPKCKEFMPIIDEMTGEFDGLVNVCKVNMGESEGEDAAVAMGVREPGAIFLYHEGDQVEGRTHDDDPRMLRNALTTLTRRVKSKTDGGDGSTGLTGDTNAERDAIRDMYAKTAEGQDMLGSSLAGCCGGGRDYGAVSQRVGYSAADVAAGGGANLGLGCGNPVELAALQPGEVVVDLGSGAGFDCFLAGATVGPEGRVIGVDMTPQMLTKARKNAKDGNKENVEFRLGEIEHLPIADNTADVVISNCVINLSVDKSQVLRDMLRVLKPGGRVAVSDVVSTAELPARLLTEKSLSC
mmetsp:Transcript_23015/g.61102  ORF Transcript_23015/g.61102 Transcript_23015/m.61102 type:complete len:326 (+) Transcript_23015:182-1159(+)